MKFNYLYLIIILFLIIICLLIITNFNLNNEVINNILTNFNDSNDIKINIPLPLGYKLDNYIVTEKLNQSCEINEACKTPFEYLIRSNCPYTSICLNSSCYVVCPDFTN